jgi:hypothetical protein
MIMSACANSQYILPSSILTPVSQCIAARMRSHKATALDASTCVWALAKLQHNDSALCDAVKSFVHLRISEFRADQLATLSWSLAKMDPNSATNKSVITEIISHFHSNRELLNQLFLTKVAQLVWSMSSTGIAHVGILEHISAQIINQLSKSSGERVRNPKVTSQDLPVIAWSVATLGFRDFSLMNAIADAAVKLDMNSFSPQNISNMAWAFGKLEVHADAFFSFVEAYLCTHMDKFNSLNTSLVIWGFAKAQIDSQAVFDIAARISIHSLQTFSPQNISNLVWSHASSGFENEMLFDEVAEHVRIFLSTPPFLFDGFE